MWLPQIPTWQTVERSAVARIKRPAYIEKYLAAARRVIDGIDRDAIAATVWRR